MSSQSQSTEEVLHGLTAAEIKTLTTKCIEAKSTAYCPYSRFHVGATVLTRDGTYISGANVENASYPVGTCAERVALGTAVVSGYRLGSIRAIGVATDIKPPASPCGMCRQFISEFCEPDMPIFMHDKDGQYVVTTIGEVSFNPRLFDLH